MKTQFMHRYVALSMAVLFVFLMGQTLQASPASNHLQKQVINELELYYPQMFKVNVTDDGTVQVKGEVNVLYDRFRIFDIVSKIPGVQRIKNETVVNAPIVADKVIEANIRDKIDGDYAISDSEPIKVTVDNGIVFLSGQVNSYHEKLMANTIASWEKGAKGIQDNIKVVPHSNMAQNNQEMETKLQDLIKSHYPHDKNVSVSVKDGVVTLKGTTRTLWNEDQLVKEVSNVRGVKDVISQLKLNQ